MSFFEQLRVAAEELGAVTKRPDLYEAIVQTNAEIVFGLTNYAEGDALTALVEKLRSVTGEACKSVNRPDLNDAIIQANSNLVYATVKINDLRMASPQVNEWFQRESAKVHGFHQGNEIMQ